MVCRFFSRARWAVPACGQLAAWLAACVAMPPIAAAAPDPASTPVASISIPSSTSTSASRPPRAHAARAAARPAVRPTASHRLKHHRGAHHRLRHVQAPRPHDDQEPDSFVYGRREDVLAFADQAAAENGLDRDWVVAALVQARYQPSVARLIMPAPAGTPKNYAAYRARFIEPQRLQLGLAWWQEHAQALDEARQRYGVPPEVVAAIVGIESFYGRLTGRYRVLDSLATLSFDFPRGRSDRSAFYRHELSAFLVWCALDDRDPTSVQGSFAGAIGWPQFMPSTLLREAVDFDHDGHVDLLSGGADVIGSVAHDLASVGWRRDEPVRFEAQPPADAAARARLLAPDILPSFTAAQMVEAGAGLPEAARAFSGPLALVELQNGADPPSYVAGTANFYAITRYNWSSYYAMAVTDLAEALRRSHDATVAFGVTR